MEPITIIAMMLGFAGVAIAIDARLQIKELRQLHEADQRYIDWYIRSIEERKADKWDVAVEEEE